VTSDASQTLRVEDIVVQIQANEVFVGIPRGVDDGRMTYHIWRVRDVERTQNGKHRRHVPLGTASAREREFAPDTKVRLGPDYRSIGALSEHVRVYRFEPGEDRTVAELSIARQFLHSKAVGVRRTP
jgi:hypothetical protein